MFQIFSSAVATALVVACGIYHGMLTDRWQTPTEPAEAAERLPAIPMTLGEWQGEDIRQGSPDPSIAGSLQRRYVNQRTGQSVLIALVCGRPGPVSIHSPDACYAASGFHVGHISRAGAPRQLGTFWNADAVRTRASEETRLRIYWAWNAGEGWSGSDNPRVEFARRPVLHKLYVLRELDSVEEGASTDPCLSFMEVLLPELDRTLFSSAQVQ